MTTLTRLLNGGVPVRFVSIMAYVYNMTPGFNFSVDLGRIYPVYFVCREYTRLYLCSFAPTYQYWHERSPYQKSPGVSTECRCEVCHIRQTHMPRWGVYISRST